MSVRELLSSRIAQHHTQPSSKPPPQHGKLMMAPPVCYPFLSLLTTPVWNDVPRLSMSSLPRPTTRAWTPTSTRAGRSTERSAPHPSRMLPARVAAAPMGLPRSINRHVFSCIDALPSGCHDRQPRPRRMGKRKALRGTRHWALHPHEAVWSPL